MSIVGIMRRECCLWEVESDKGVRRADRGPMLGRAMRKGWEHRPVFEQASESVR